MKKFILAPALAALVMFFWGFCYYGLSGVPYRALEQAPGLAAAVSSLTVDGAYMVPDPRIGEEAMAEAMKTGPYAMIQFRKVPADMGSTMIKGYLHGFISCVLVALLLVRCESSLTTFGCRLMFCVVIGGLITFYSNGATSIWWQHSWSWNGMTMFYDAVSWLLAGLVLAKMVAPKKA
ncbi:MAG: hypothetical protein Q8M02_12600 [Candidatus Didemnitutus sp.]|nr:hypothetical protein [Candidatus Didemnitutus sp.]